MTRLVVLAFLPLFITPPSKAESDFGIGVRASNHGIGIEGTWRPPVSWLDLRLGAKTLEFQDYTNATGLSSDRKLALSNFYATANLLLPQSPLRVTAGLFNIVSESSLSGPADGSIETGVLPMNMRDVAGLRRDSYLPGTAPYLGFGLDFAVSTRLDFNFDLGLLWQGDSSTSAGRPIANELIIEAASEPNDVFEAFGDYRARPAVSIGLVFNFK